MREYLEENYESGLSEEATVELAVRCLLEVVESEKNMDICVVRAKDAESLSEERLGQIVTKVKAEKEAAEAAKKQKKPQ